MPHAVAPFDRLRMLRLYSSRPRLSQKATTAFGYGRCATAKMRIAATMKASSSPDTKSAAKMQAFVEATYAIAAALVMHFSTLCTIHISAASAVAPSSPYSRNLDSPRFDLIRPNTGYTVCLRKA